MSRFDCTSFTKLPHLQKSQCIVTKPVYLTFKVPEKQLLKFMSARLKDFVCILNSKNKRVNREDILENTYILRALYVSRIGGKEENHQIKMSQ